MSSWKQYGGIKQIKSASINVSNISVDDILLRKAYSGNFNINGSIIVSVDAQISGKLIVNDDTSLKDVSMNNLSVSSNSIFNGNVYTNQTLNANTIISNTISSTGNINAGSKIFLNTPHYFYGDLSGIGIGLDTIHPTATFDISSNIVSALNVNTTSGTNKNILACNNSKNGIILGANGSNSTIDFFTSNNTNTNSVGDSYIYASNDGSLTMHCQNTTHVLSNMLITGPDVNNDASHLMTESLTVYDNSGSIPYFSDVYNNSTNPVIFGKNAVFRASIPNTSVSSISLIDNSSCGAIITGGSYPLDKTKSMLSHGLLDKNGNYMPTETIVRGTSTNTKYLATTGINTYTPNIDNYVLDINGPVRFDNGDIVNVNNTNFEILFMKHAIDPSYKNYIMAVGASIDISGQYPLGYRYSVLYSSNYGATWNSSILKSTSDTPTNNVLYGTNTVINEIDVYDCSYAVISGNNGTLAYTYNGGITWQNINIIIQNNSDNEIAHYNFQALKIKAQNNNFSTTTGISVYISADPSNNLYSYTNTFDNSKSSYYTFTKPSNNSISYFTKFDVSFNLMNGSVVSKGINLYNSYTSPTVINSIGVSQNKLYLAGTRLISYNLSNLTTPTLICDPIANYSLNSSIINYYVWSKIYVYSDTSATAIAIGINNSFDGRDHIDIQTSMITVISNNTVTNWDSFNTNFFKTTIQYIYTPPEPTVTVYIPMQCVIKDIYVYDNNNSIVVGYCTQFIGIGGTITNTHVNGSFILVTYDGGITWNDMGTNLLNASGKQNLLISSQLYPNTICIPDPNTLLFSYSTQFTSWNQSSNYPYYISSTSRGKSIIYSCFSPNYLNLINNQLIDICGNMSVYGSLYAKNLTYVTSSSLSDYRIKTDISSIDSYTVDNLNPIQYRNMLTGNHEFGFLAHELKEQIPLLVEGEKDGTKYQSINYISLIALLVKEIKDLKKLVTDLNDAK